MPPKEQLVITAEEEAIIKQKIIEQTATLQPGKDYPLRKLVKTFFALNDAIDAGGEGLDAAQEAFLTELDTYEFSMGRYSTVVAANRTQMESYDDEEEALAAKTRELKSQDAELKGKLHETVRERAFRTARDEAVRACGEYPSRAESASIAEGLKKAIAEGTAHLGELDVAIERKKRCYALLLKVIDDASRA
jgi:THO complex subunit 7